MISFGLFSCPSHSRADGGKGLGTSALGVGPEQFDDDEEQEKPLVTDDIRDQR